MLRLNLMRLSPTLNNALRQKLKVVAFERIGIRQVTRRHAWLVTLDIFAHDHTAIVATLPTRFKPHAPHDTTFTSSHTTTRTQTSRSTQPSKPNKKPKHTSKRNPH